MQMTTGTIEFFSELYKGFDKNLYFEIRRINDGSPAEVEFFTLKELYAFDWKSYLLRHAGSNNYYSVNPRNTKEGKEANVPFAVGYWADVDDKQFSGGKKEIIERVNKWFANLLPTITIDSGHGFHFIWLTDTPLDMFSEFARESLKKTNKQIAVVLKGDNVGDLPRILRIPGSINVKDSSAPVPCEIVSFHPERRYTDQFFTMTFYQIWQNYNGFGEKTAKIGTNLQKNDKITKSEEKESLDKDEKWIVQTISNEIKEGKRNTTVTRLAGYCCKKRIPQDIAQAIISAVMTLRCNPPMDAEERERTVTGVFSRYGEEEKSRIGAKLIKVNAPIPYYYFLMSDGVKIELTLEELVRFSLFEKKYYSVVNSFPTWITRDEWKSYLSGLEIKIEESPKDASQDEAFYEKLIGWLNHQGEATDINEFKLGKVIIEDGYIFFNSQKIWDKFRQHNINLDKSQLYKIIAERGGGAKTKRIKDKTVKAWYVRDGEEKEGNNEE